MTVYHVVDVEYASKSYVGDVTIGDSHHMSPKGEVDVDSTN